MKSKLALFKLSHLVWLSIGIAACSQVSAWAESEIGWVPAVDQAQVKQIGDWQETSFRYAAKPHLLTITEGAALEFQFEGTAVAIRFGAHAVPAYGVANRGTIIASIDGEQQRSIHPLASPREIVLARRLSEGPHLLRIEHRGVAESTGCRIEAFQALSQPSGDLLFHVSGEENAFLVDARALLRKDGRIIRNQLVRNWLSGQCSLVNLPPGKDYSLELQAIGWQTSHIDNIAIAANQTTSIAPVFLARDQATVISRFRFPALNRQAIRIPGQSFPARFLGFQADIAKVELRRTVGAAVISRTLEFEEDQAAAYYYDREIIAKLPSDMPPGIYDLNVHVVDQYAGGKRTGMCRSARSVQVVSEFPTDPVLVTFGHLDTAGQYQAEYLQRLASMANLLAADVVLDSTAVNPAYISGALSNLDMPYLVNFGNHQFYGHEQWYGDPVSMVNFGPDFSVLNFGHPWHDDYSKADALLSSRANCRYKIINAFESNAPVQWLDKHQVCMIHDAHGTGEKNTDLGSTPTRRVGKVNSVSFRVVRLKDGRVASSTYQGHKVNPIPFGREQTPPLRVNFEPQADGHHGEITATVSNDYEQTFPRCRLTFVLPKGHYQVDQGEIESSIASDDQKYVVLSVRVDVAMKDSIAVRVRPAD